MLSARYVTKHDVRFPEEPGRNITPAWKCQISKCLCPWE